jgi:hypothetical protein
VAQGLDALGARVGLHSICQPDHRDTMTEFIRLLSR